MRFVFAEHPPRPDANLISVHADSLVGATVKIREDLMWITKIGDRLYDSAEGTYMVYFNEEGMELLKARYGVSLPHDMTPPPYDEDDPAEHDGARD